MGLTVILTTVAIVGGVGLFIGWFLGIAGLIFKVKVNEQEEAVLNALPGNNCGGCGFPGCSGLAAAIVDKTAPVNACPVGGAAVGRTIAAIMGVEAGAAVRLTAYVACRGNQEAAAADYDYTGVMDCAMQAFVPGGGAKSCNYGCLGYGNCVRACQFGAITVQNGVAVVDREQCKACKQCVAACPKQLIEMIPYASEYMVGCRSGDKGVVTAKVCSVGCIGCGICRKNCPAAAIAVEDFCAVIDQEKCTGCGICAEKCPKKSIEIK